MNDSNPYQSPDNASRIATVPKKPRSRWKWAMVGFALGAAAPVALGVLGMHQHDMYVASLGPNESACGMIAFGAIVMIFVLGPISGLIGAGLGLIASGIDRWNAW